MSSNNYDYDPSLVQRFLSEYQDRGMLKRQGFYLSDHTAKLNQDQEQAKARLQHQHLASAQMSEAQITQIINQAVMKHLTVKEIGRASCRERVKISVVAVTLKKKKNKDT